METKNVAIIGIWAFMIVLLILSFVERSDLLVVFFLFFVALIVTVYLASASGKNATIIIIFLILALILSILYLTPVTRIASTP
jgi:hypothetical protein